MLCRRRKTPDIHTEQQPDGPLVTQVLAELLIAQRGHGSQQTYAVAHVGLPAASAPGTTAAAPLSKVGICLR